MITSEQKELIKYTVNQLGSIVIDRIHDIVEYQDSVSHNEVWLKVKFKDD